MLDCDTEADFGEALRLALYIGVQDVRRNIKKRTGKQLMARLHMDHRNYHRTTLHTVYSAGRTNEEIAAKARILTE